MSSPSHLYLNEMFSMHNFKLTIFLHSSRTETILCNSHRITSKWHFLQVISVLYNKYESDSTKHVTEFHSVSVYSTEQSRTLCSAEDDQFERLHLQVVLAVEALSHSSLLLLNSYLEFHCLITNSLPQLQP